jgi:hypothetical protein
VTHDKSGFACYFAPRKFQRTTPPESRDVPLRHREVGNTHQTDSPGTPRLRCRPFDRVVVIFRVLLSEDSGVSFGFVHASNIRLKDGVALPDPVHRIRCFEARQP